MSEFKGTKRKIHAVEYAGVIIMQDGEYYENKNILDYDQVGEEIAIANGKLFECAPEMLEMLKNIKDYLGSDNRFLVEQLIKKATE